MIWNSCPSIENINERDAPALITRRRYSLLSRIVAGIRPPRSSCCLFVQFQILPPLMSAVSGSGSLTEAGLASSVYLWQQRWLAGGQQLHPQFGTCKRLFCCYLCRRDMPLPIKRRCITRRFTYCLVNLVEAHCLRLMGTMKRRKQWFLSSPIMSTTSLEIDVGTAHPEVYNKLHQKSIRLWARVRMIPECSPLNIHNKLVVEASPTGIGHCENAFNISNESK